MARPDRRPGRRRPPRRPARPGHQVVPVRRPARHAGAVGPGRGRTREPGLHDRRPRGTAQAPDGRAPRPVRPAVATAGGQRSPLGRRTGASSHGRRGGTGPLGRRSGGHRARLPRREGDRRRTGLVPRRLRARARPRRVGGAAGRGSVGAGRRGRRRPPSGTGPGRPVGGTVPPLPGRDRGRPERPGRPQHVAEIDQVARTHNEMLYSLSELLRHERDFTANASHQLRTPSPVSSSPWRPASPRTTTPGCDPS